MVVPPLNLESGRLRQETHDVQANWGYKIRPCQEKNESTKKGKDIAVNDFQLINKIKWKNHVKTY